MFRSFLSFLLVSCSGVSYKTSLESVDLNRLMGDWYVMATRPTYFEQNAFNGIESYEYDSKTQKIKIQYKFNQGSPKGEVKLIKQDAYVFDKKSNAHWKVSPFWPLEFDFLIIDVAQDYSWAAIGVPNQKYLWVMSRDYKVSKEEIEKMVKSVEKKGYSTLDLIYLKHDYSK